MLLLLLVRRRRWPRGLAILTLLLFVLTGCDTREAEPERTVTDTAACSGDFDEFSPGLSKQANSGDLEVAIVTADPSPPVVRSDNAWRVRVTDVDGEPIDDAELIVSPFMPQHQHGAAEVLVEHGGEGEYQLAPIQLIMPGIWEIPISVTPTGRETSDVTFRLCIAEQ